jgi:hypothetical protein
MTIPRVLVIALVATVASACGARTTERMGAPTAKPAAPATLEPPPAASDDGASSGGSIMIFTDRASSTRSAQEVYAVFHRPLDAGDRAAAVFARSDGFRPAPEESGLAAHQLGRPIYSETRLVAGTTHRGMYATPTTSGAVCTGRFPNGGGGCGPPGPHGFTLEWDDPGDGTPLQLYGLAEDDVRAVEIVVGDHPQRADVVDNAYVLDVPGAGHADMGSIVLHLTNGSTVDLS